MDGLGVDLRFVVDGISSPSILFPVDDVLVGVKERTMADGDGIEGVWGVVAGVDDVGRRETVFELVATWERVGDRFGERGEYVEVEPFVFDDEVTIRLGWGRGNVCKFGFELCGGEWLLRLVEMVRTVP